MNSSDLKKLDLKIRELYKERHLLLIKYRQTPNDILNNNQLKANLTEINRLELEEHILLNKLFSK